MNRHLLNARDDTNDKKTPGAHMWASCILGKSRQAKLLNAAKGQKKDIPTQIRHGFRGGHMSTVGSSSTSMQVEVISDVPYIKQTGSYGCWDATMNMIRKYFGAEPLGKECFSYLYDAEGNPKALDSQLDYKTRNRRANLINIPAPEDKQWTIENLYSMLDKFGPVEATIYTDESYDHAIVLIGVDRAKENVIYHDPAEQEHEWMSLSDFNERFCWRDHRSALTAYKK